MENSCAGMDHDTNFPKALMNFLRLSESENVFKNILYLFKLSRNISKISSLGKQSRKKTTFFSHCSKITRDKFYKLMHPFIYFFFLSQTKGCLVCFQNIFIMFHYCTAVFQSFQIQDMNKVILLPQHFDLYMAISVLSVHDRIS